MSKPFQRGFLLLVIVATLLCTSFPMPRKVTPRYKPAKVLAMTRKVMSLLEDSRQISNSKALLERVDLPFQLYDGLILVNATWSKRKVTCIFDTGSEHITWPANMELEKQKLEVPALEIFPNGIETWGEWMLSSCIHLQGYTINDLPTVAANYSVQAQDITGWLARNHVVILGDWAFRNKVVTIDYQTSTISIRSSQYDIRKIHISPRARLIEFSRERGGHIVVRGLINDITASLVIDTGMGDVALNANFARTNHFKPNPSRYSHIPLNVPKSNVTESYVDISVAGLELPKQRYHIVTLPSAAKGVLGYEVLKNFRITIDYARKLLLLEP